MAAAVCNALISDSVYRGSLASDDPVGCDGGTDGGGGAVAGVRFAAGVLAIIASASHTTSLEEQLGFSTFPPRHSLVFYVLTINDGLH